jgi:hypothetical protein
MQGERSFGFGIEGHASRSFRPGRDATPATGGIVGDGGVKTAAGDLSPG